MATSLGDALGSADVKDDNTLVGIVPTRQATHFYLYDAVNDLTFLAPLTEVRLLLAAPDIFSDDLPGATPGNLNQRYWRTRAYVANIATRADLYVYNGTTWGQPKIVGYVLDGTTPNPSPLVALEINPTSINLGDSANLIASPSSPNGTPITQVAFFDGSLQVGISNAAPWVYTYTPDAQHLGQRSITAVVTDDLGGMATSLVRFLSVTLNGPIIDFPAPGAKTTASPPFQLAATSNNTVTPITYASSNTNVISISGSTATVVGVGTATITASQAAGNGYAAGSATQAVTVTVPLVTAYVGTITGDTATASQVQALPSQQWDKSARTLTIACSNVRPVFAEPQAQGIRTISDKNGFQLAEGSDYNRQSVTLTINGQSVLYWLYVHVYLQDDSSFVYQLASL